MVESHEGTNDDEDDDEDGEDFGNGEKYVVLFFFYAYCQYNIVSW